jgi:hemoglobin-like flavoprotein
VGRGNLDLDCQGGPVMMFPDLDAVTASYHRCRDSAGFLDTFYQRFLAKSQEVADKFRGTHFTRQKLMLRESLLAMLLFNLGSADARAELERLGQRHSRRGVDIPPHLYNLWLDALCEAVEEHDPEFTADIGNQWRGAMRPGIELLVAHY